MGELKELIKCTHEVHTVGPHSVTGSWTCGAGHLYLSTYQTRGTKLETAMLLPAHAGKSTKLQASQTGMC